MNLIYFKSNKSYTTTVIEEQKTTGDIKEAKTKQIKHYFEYWIPEDKIKLFHAEKGKYFINDIEVPDIEFFAVIGMIECSHNPALYRHFKDRDFKIVDNRVQLNLCEKENSEN